MTRHERTLHADGAEQQRDQQDQAHEYVGDQVNVACAPPGRSSALETPPRDLDEASDEIHGQEPLGNGQALQGLPSPGAEASSTASSTSTFSTRAAATVHCRRSSKTLPPGRISRSRDMISPTTAGASHVVGHGRTPPAATAHAYSQSQSTTAHPGYNAGCHSPDFATIYRTTQGNGTNAIDPNLSTSMNLNTEMSTAQGGNPAVSPHSDQSQDRSGLPAPLGQDHDPSFFSPLPDVNLDLGAFSFSPLSGNIMDVDHLRPNPQLSNDFELQSHHVHDFEAMPNFGPLPPQIVSGFGTAHSHATHAETPEGDTADIPMLLEERRRPRPVLTLDHASYLSIRSDLAQRLFLPDHEIDLPPADVCQGFLSSYIANFHGHLPTIHLQTLSLKGMASPLFLALCSIGALYRLDRRRARQLYHTAARSVETVRVRKLPSQNYLTVQFTWTKANWKMST